MYRHRKKEFPLLFSGQIKRVSVNVGISSDDKNVYCGTQSGDLLMVNLERCLFKKTAGNKKNFPQGITATKLLENGDIICGTGAGLLVRFNAADLSVAKIRKEALLGAITSITITADGTHM